MPPPPLRRKGKEPKETVIYPSSKRPAPPFKPLRPSKVPRVEPETVASTSKRPPPSKAAVSRKPSTSKITTNRTKDAEENESSKTLSSDHELDLDDDDDDVEEITSKPPTIPRKRQQPSHTSAPPRQPSPAVSISSSHEAATETRAIKENEKDPLPSQSDPVPSIPQPLLLRLLHESFTDKNTKIDKHALQVLQKYMEIFVREAIARAKHAKIEARGEEGGEDESELGGTWLDLEDLERVAPGLLCDF